MLRVKPALFLVLALACGALALAACGGSATRTTSSGATQPTQVGPAAGRAAAPGSSGGSVKMIMIGGSPSDPFWSAVLKGGRDAAAGIKSRGASFDFLGPANYNNLGPDLARLEQTALARRPDIVLSGNFIPGAQSAGLKALAAAQIPLIEYNTGATTWKADGAIRYIGTDEKVAGVSAGQGFVKAGAKRVMCVNAVPGNPGVEARCAGVKQAVTAGGGTATELELPATEFGDPGAITQAIKGALIKDAAVDGVIATAANVTDYAWNALNQARRADKITLGTFDVSLSNLKRIADDKQLLAIDQQPYLQGYMAVSMAFLYVKWGLLPSDEWLKTGPLVITKQNVTPVLAGAKAGVRGAA